MMIVKKPIQYAVIIDKQGDCGVFDTMNDAIESAYVASEKYSNYSLSRKKEIIDVFKKELEEHMDELNIMACKEIGTKSYNDNIYKTAQNTKCVENELINNDEIENSETPSYVVNGVIVNLSNPIETIIKNSISILETGHAIVFSSHPNLKNVFAYAIQLINKAIQAVDGPKNLIVTVKEPSIENTNIMIEHEKITMIPAIANHNAEKIAL